MSNRNDIVANPPRILYRYMTARHSLSFIKDPWLKITPPSQFNDVYEVTPTPSKSLEGDDILGDKGALTQMAAIISRSFGRQVRRENLVSLAAEHPRVWSALVRRYLDGIDTWFAFDFLRMASITSGVACFTEDPLSHLMWNHYGDASKGVVLGLDTQSNFFWQNPLMKVVYTNRRVKLPDLNSTRPRARRRPPTSRQYQYVNFLGGTGDLVRTKSVSLRHEKEWRICVLLALCKNRSRGMYFRRIPRSCIRKVLIGARCPEATAKRIAAATRKHLPNLVIETVRLSRSRFELESATL